MSKFCVKCGARLEDEDIYCYQCGAKQQAPDYQGNSSMYGGYHHASQTNKSKDNKYIAVGIIMTIAVWLVLGGLFLLIGFFGLEEESSEKYINFVKEGTSDTYPDITYEDAFEAYFSHPKWNYFNSDEDEDVVEFTGKCKYEEKTVTASVQFTLDYEEGTFEITYWAIDDAALSISEINDFVTVVFDSYESDKTF